MRSAAPWIVSLSLSWLVAACGGERTLKAAGEECFGTSDCQAGLTCDFGRSPHVCAGEQTVRPDATPVPPTVDAAPGIDAPPGAVVDASPGRPDAAPGAPDAMPPPPTPDAMPPPPTPDAMPPPPTPDAAPPGIDAAP